MLHLFSGNCNFDDQNMEVDKSFDSLDAVSLPTLDDCKNRCDGYEDGSNQCWVIKYHASSENCYLYVSTNPRQYLSNKANSNRNVFYSTRDCFSGMNNIHEFKYYYCLMLSDSDKILFKAPYIYKKKIIQGAVRL